MTPKLISPAAPDASYVYVGGRYAGIVCRGVDVQVIFAPGLRGHLLHVAPGPDWLTRFVDRYCPVQMLWPHECICSVCEVCRGRAGLFKNPRAE